MVLGGATEAFPLVFRGIRNAVTDVARHALRCVIHAAKSAGGIRLLRLPHPRSGSEHERALHVFSTIQRVVLRLPTTSEALCAEKQIACVRLGQRPRRVRLRPVPAACDRLGQRPRRVGPCQLPVACVLLWLLPKPVARVRLGLAPGLEALLPDRMILVFHSAAFFPTTDIPHVLLVLVHLIDHFIVHVLTHTALHRTHLEGATVVHRLALGSKLRVGRQAPEEIGIQNLRRHQRVQSTDRRSLQLPRVAGVGGISKHGR